MFGLSHSTHCQSLSYITVDMGSIISIYKNASFLKGVAVSISIYFFFWDFAFIFTGFLSGPMDLNLVLHSDLLV
jgi:hypothetical protein